MTGSELWTTAEAAAYLGASPAGSGRKTLSRLGVAPVSREPGRAGQNLYDASQVRAAKARMSGRGKRSAASAPCPAPTPSAPPGCGATGTG